VAGGAGISGALYVGGAAVIGGNLTVQGNTITINSSTLSIQDPIINLGTPADLTPLSSPTTADIGLKFHYYDSADSAAFLGRATSDGTLVWYSRGSDSANVFTGTVLGNVKIGSMLIANSTASTSTTTGALQIAGGAGISGALYNGGVHISSGNIVAASGTASTSTTTGALVVTGGAGVAGALYNGGVHISSGNIVAASGTASTSTTTGALVVAGGAGISGNVFTGGWIVPTANVTQNLGSTTNYWNNIYAITSTVVATTAKYADLAENYQADKAYMAGTVMMFGGSAEVTVADADTTRVAGIVSTNPAHLMNGGLTGAGVVPLALQGRVPCQVIGPVRKGDIMVSAGHGFARVNNTPAAGQAIGKALQEVTFPGKAVIEVVVGRI
jgi:ribosomal protein S28E/S33